MQSEISPTDRHAPLLIAALGLLVMYGPTFLDLATKTWLSDEQGHGPLVLAGSLWLMLQRLKAFNASGETVHPSAWGWLWLGIAAFAFVLGRSQSTLFFEVGSLVLSLAGLVLLLLGSKALRSMAFPLFFLCFMVPLPDTFVDAVTLPMKTAVSYATDAALSLAGYPVARTGVILQIGQYQLLVADACAGLHTLLALEAFGLLYLNVVHHSSLFRNVALAALIVPISFAANVIRVVALCLITYHLGDAAGQGFLHGFAGVMLYLTALLLVIAADSALRWLYRSRRGLSSGGSREQLAA